MQLGAVLKKLLRTPVVRLIVTIACSSSTALLSSRSVDLVQI